MAKPLTIDKKEVHATYLATGSLQETARLHGVKDSTIRQWAKRYNWETAKNVQKLRDKADAIVELKREKGHDDVTPVSRSVDALRIHLDNSSHAFKTNMAGALARSSEALASMDGYTALDNSRRMVDLATAASKVFPGMEEAGIQVNVLSMGLDGFVLPPKAVDV
jgi:hypothetical protein